jgi:uncharacterized protein YhfF
VTQRKVRRAVRIGRFGWNIKQPYGRRAPVAVIETTSVRVVPLAQVDLAHVLDEGEGLTTVAGWRAEHELGWHSAEQREEFGDQKFTVNDETLVVLERFRLVEDLRTT